MNIFLTFIHHVNLFLFREKNIYYFSRLIQKLAIAKQHHFSNFVYDICENLIHLQKKKIDPKTRFEKKKKS